MEAVSGKRFREKRVKGACFVQNIALQQEVTKIAMSFSMLKPKKKKKVRIPKNKKSQR